MSKILVTGGSGFIGSHTCLSLLENNYDVVVIDSFINSSPIALDRVRKIYDSRKVKDKKIEIFKGDLRFKEDLDNVFYKSNSEGKPIKAVIHFAGLKSVSESLRSPLMYWDNNILGTINLLNVMNKNKCFNLVFSSSATIYANSKDNLVDEKSVIGPVNPYGFTKATIEKILENLFYSDPKKWRIANLRYFNPIGAHTSGLLGENPSGIPNNIFPYILKVASGKLEYLKVFGKNWSTPDGTGVRDYIHILDLADGHILALENLLNSNPQQINLNIGTGISTSVLGLLSCFEKVNKVKIPYCFTDKRDGDVASVVANNSLAISHLKWKPKRNLEEMCIDGWRWERMNPNGYE